jgi:hypothetical protein
MILYQTDACTIALPLPLFLVIEDVGWWEGEDGSAGQQPYRNGFPRRHCLADYVALVDLAERLSSRIAIAMVIGEWDRSNRLRDIPGATWMGRAWDNRRNQGPWLDETAAFLQANRQHLELAVHGLCHECWREGTMERSEFHDPDCRMRPRDMVISHLQAYHEILEENGWKDFPRLFVPPALRHSFGNGDNSMQAVLRDFGITHVTTRFDRARRYSPPIHKKLTWECGVALLERGISPVPWHQAAALPVMPSNNPVVALHWGNLLHPDPQRNHLVVEGWARMLLAATGGLERVMAIDAAACWHQAAVCFLGEYRSEPQRLIIDLGHLPPLASLRGPFFLKVHGGDPEKWECQGASLLVSDPTREDIRTVAIDPVEGCRDIRIELN